MFNANTIAHAKLVFNAKIKTYKLVVAFNAHKQVKKIGNAEVVKYAFPTQAKCAYVSGDLLAENLQQELTKALHSAQRTIRSNNIVFVD